MSRRTVPAPGLAPAAPDLAVADSRAEFQKLYETLTQSSARNQLICRDVIAAAQAGRFPLVLTERTEHLRLLATQLSAAIPHVITLQGGMGKKQIQAAMASLAEVPDGQGRVLLATGRYIGEGFDEPRLDTLFLTLPVSWRGTIAQYVGRLHRLHADKREVQVYDYADLDIPMLARMFERRCAGYEAEVTRCCCPPARRPKPESPSASGFGLRISELGLRASDFKATRILRLTLSAAYALICHSNPIAMTLITPVADFVAIRIPFAP